MNKYVKLSTFWVSKYVYKLTGWYPWWIRLYEYEHVESQLGAIEKRMAHPDNDMSLKSHVGLTIGIWQCDHGFTRRMRRFENRSRRFK